MTSLWRKGLHQPCCAEAEASENDAYRTLCKSGLFEHAGNGVYIISGVHGCNGVVFVVRVFLGTADSVRGYVQVVCRCDFWSKVCFQNFRRERRKIPSACFIWENIPALPASGEIFAPQKGENVGNIFYQKDKFFYKNKNFLFFRMVIIPFFA